MSALVLRGALMPWHSDSPVDVTVADGLISRIEPSGPAAQPAAGELVDCSGLVLLPAFVDLHTHIREPGRESAETAESASRAALAGGFTMIHAMANTTPVADRPEVIDAVWQRGLELDLVTVRPVGAITIGLEGRELAPIAAMHDTAAAPLLFSDDGHCVQRADLMRAALRGLPVTAEVTPHHLLLTDDCALTGDPVYKVNPPLRSTHDVVAVREALADGTIDIVATDHAPHEQAHKSCAWPDAAMGMLGLETAFAVVFDSMVASGLMSWERLCDAMSLAPARIAGTDARVPAAGTRADLVLVDPEALWSVEPSSLQSLSRNTPFTARALRGSVAMTIRGGRILFTDTTARTHT
ncbi:MAG: dihydroorotase [Actinobacteria bacterium]|nr:dihydroorotase [Actinomycetota bacterium]